MLTSTIYQYTHNLQYSIQQACDDYQNEIQIYLLQMDLLEKILSRHGSHTLHQIHKNQYRYYDCDHHNIPHDLRVLDPLAST